MSSRKLLNIVLVILLIAFVSCDKEVSTSAPIDPVPIGYLFVDSSPQGMKIYEDGRNSGKTTPDSLSWLPEKQYKITLKQELYRDTTLVVDVVEGEKKSIFVDYYKSSKMRARIKCISNPESANIFINDSLIEAKTPHVINNLMPGEYTIKYSLDQHRDRSRFVRAESNLESLAFLKLQDTSVWVDYRTDTSPIPEDYLNCLDVDSNGVIWVGTSQHGLVSFNPQSGVWANYNTNNSSIADDYILDIDVDRNNDLWIATTLGVVFKSGENFQVFNIDNSILESNEINTISIDYNDNIWVGTKAGFYSKDNNGWKKHTTYRSGAPFNYVSSVAFDTKGEIWVGTYFKGIGRYVDNEWIIYTNNQEDLIGSGGGYNYEPLPSNSVSASIVEQDGERVWFGHIPNKTGPGGVSTYNQVTKKWSFNSVYVPSPIINSFYYGPNKKVWICTDKGVVEWKYGYKVHFLNQDIRALSVDKDKKLVWLASQGNGLIKLKQ